MTDNLYFSQKQCSCSACVHFSPAKNCRHNFMIHIPSKSSPLHALLIYGIIIAYSCIVLAFHRTQAAFDKVRLCASFAPPKGEGDAEG